MLHRECPGLWLAVAAIAISLFSSEIAVAQDVPVDLELVLAVDISLSMDEDEQRLQRDGYITSFRNPEIIEAIKFGSNGRIAVTYVEWAGESFQQIVIPWTLIDGTDTALNFADKLAAAPIAQSYRTSISGALIYAAGLFDGNGYQGRQAIDVSGDGANKVQLDHYYQDCVIGGTGAFIIPIRNVSEFVPTIRRKLILEIARRDLPILHSAATSPRSGADCLIGEKMWNQWMERFNRE
jgi:Protein of unknown function (DUF1194)